MQHTSVSLASLEELRESGGYARIASLLGDGWRQGHEFAEDTIRARMLAAELAGRAGRIDEMEAALAPYLDQIESVPFGLSARVLLTVASYHYRRNEPTAALRLASLARTIAAVREDDMILGEAVQLQGQAHWSLERWSEAASSFEEAINIYAGQSRAYRVGLAYLYLGAVLNRMGKVEESRTTLERCVKILLKTHDDYNLAVARLNVALALNVMGDHDTALKYLEFAYTTFDRIKHEQYAYLTLNTIAATLVWLKEYDRAESYIDRAVEMGVKARSTQIASTYEIKGRIFIARREWHRAERALNTAYEIAEQANSLSQKAEVRRTMGRLYLAQNRDEEAAAVLWNALDVAEDLRASLIALEVKALLAQATCGPNPVEACRMLSDVESELGRRPLPELRKEVQAARRRIDSLDQEHYFILSDARVPLLADAKISLLKWLWARALYKAKGNSRDAASILGVTPTYIRKLTKVIPRDLLRPGKKRSKRK